MSRRAKKPGRAPKVPLTRLERAALAETAVRRTWGLNPVARIVPNKKKRPPKGRPELDE